jgi:uncharacterized membrane protein
MYGRRSDFMLLNAKKLAFLGLLLAVTVVLIILSGVFEFNTLFLLAAASFGVGIAIRKVISELGQDFILLRYWSASYWLQISYISLPFLRWGCIF